MEERTWYGVPGIMTGILATGNSGRIRSFNGLTTDGVATCLSIRRLSPLFPGARDRFWYRVRCTRYALPSLSALYSVTHIEQDLEVQLFAAVRKIERRHL
jgi:hypothetical protein